MHTLTTIMNIAMLTLIAPAALVAIGMRIVARVRYQEAAKYCRRTDDGRIYVRDPQTGTMHILRVIDGKVTTEPVKLTRSDKKRIKRTRQRIRERIREAIR
jgi:hypothetical protein